MNISNSAGTESYDCQFVFDITTSFDPTKKVDATIGGRRNNSQTHRRVPASGIYLAHRVANDHCGIRSDHARRRCGSGQLVPLAGRDRDDLD